MKVAGKRIRTFFRANILLLILLLGIVVHASVVTAQSPGKFTETGNMTAAHAGATGTLMPNGKVLIASKDGSAEVYDPATGSFTTAGHIASLWLSSTTTLLGDGTVLVVGNDGTQNSAYEYDSAVQTFTLVGSTVTGQRGGWATLLRSGKVLIAGGVTGYLNGGVAQMANPEVYDPSTGKFTATGAFATKGTLDVKGGPDISTASLLPDGRVLFAAEPSSEVYDPVSGSFSLTGSMTTLCADGEKPTYIESRTATVLQNGRVLLTGGVNEDCGYFANAELYDPSNGKFNSTGDMTRSRYNHTATLLPDGTVLIAGGESTECSAGRCIFSGTTASAESYDPSTGTFATIGNMTAARTGQTATLLKNGTVLIAGGYAYGPGMATFPQDLNSAELYAPLVLAPVLAVTDLEFDRITISAGFSYTANLSGSRLNEQTFFDVRFRVPGSTLDQEALNWQRGTSASHVVSLGTATGIWTVTGIRAHQLEIDHTAIFAPVSTTMMVFP
jgi:hypothetical protein